MGVSIDVTCTDVAGGHVSAQQLKVLPGMHSDQHPPALSRNHTRDDKDPTRVRSGDHEIRVQGDVRPACGIFIVWWICMAFPMRCSAPMGSIACCAGQFNRPGSASPAMPAGGADEPAFLAPRVSGQNDSDATGLL